MCRAVTIPVSLERALLHAPLFSTLDNEVLVRIAAGTTPLTIRKDRFVFKPEDSWDGTYLVVSGQIKLSLQNGIGTEKTIDLLGPGGAIGVAFLFSRSSYSYAAQALRDSVLLHIDKRTLVSEIERTPALATLFVMHLSGEFARLLGTIERYTLRSGTQRVSEYMLAQATASGPGNGSFRFPAKKRIIASQLSLTQEHFSRILRALVAERAIEVHGSLVDILDRDKLKLLAG